MASWPKCCSRTPFRPSSLPAISWPGRPRPTMYELRWAGLKAHNRWLADFCAETPGRRAGMAQIFLNDVDDAVAEIVWAREHGLFGGILLPGVPPDSGLPPLFAPDYDPIWAACQDLDMPVNNHSGAAGPECGDHLASMAVFMVELGWFSHRVFWHMALGGVFARYPKLALVLTEQSAGWVPAVLGMLDHQYSRFTDPNTAESHFGGELVKEVPEPPSYYWKTQLLCRRQLLPAGRGPPAPRHRRRQDHVGPGLSPYRGHLPLHARRPCATRSPVSIPRRWRPMVGLNAARCYGFDLERPGTCGRTGRTLVDEVNVPLEHVPADSHSIAFAGEN